MSNLIGRRVTAHVEVSSASSESGTKTEVKQVIIMDKVINHRLLNYTSGTAAGHYNEYVVMESTPNDKNVQRVYTIKPEDIIHI